MPPTNCTQANQSAGNGPLVSGGELLGCTAAALTRVSAPQWAHREQTGAGGSRLASGARIGARLAGRAGSTPNELTMCKGRQVYDYICIDCEWAKSCSLSLLLLSLSLLLLLLLELLLPLVVLLPFSLDGCWLLAAGLSLLLAGRLCGAAPRDAHLEAPIISGAAGKGLLGASNRIILDSSKVETGQRRRILGDTNVKCKRHGPAANLRGGAPLLAHYEDEDEDELGRCCHYGYSFTGLGVSERGRPPQPSRSRSRPSRSRPSGLRLLCVSLLLLPALLLLNAGGGSPREPPTRAKGRPSIMLAAAAEHRFTSAPQAAHDNGQAPLDARPAGHRVGHRNDRGPTSGAGPPARHSQRPAEHSSHAGGPPLWPTGGGAGLIGGGGRAANLLLLPWGQSASGAQHLDSGACAPGCVCLWKNGKQAADCSHGSQSQGPHQHQLQHRHQQQQQQQQQHPAPGRLPVGLDPLTQVLNLTGQPLGELAAGAFASLQLTNLQRIHLAKCQLSLIHARAFERLKLLVELELSWNQLRAVPVPGSGGGGAPAGPAAAATGQMQLLRRLVMRGNPLGALEERTILPAGASASPTASSPPRPLLERLLETYPELAPALASSSELALAKLLASAQAAAAGTQVESARDQLWAQLEAALEATDRAQHTAGLQPLMDWQPEPADGAPKDLLAAYFPQIQELDFGHCQLAYIKWNVFAHLNQLKRLLLDGNQLSQLSGQLVRLLPVNLHQLALDGNPLVCDCRALALARWLASSRTPLSSPVRCQQQQQQAAHRAARGAAPKSLGASPAGDDSLHDELVCPPQPLEPSKLASPGEPSPPPLQLLIHYLWPTLIRNSQELNGSLVEESPQQQQSRPEEARSQPLQVLQVREGDKIALRCPLLAYPEWSVHFVWLVEYGEKGASHSQPQAALGAGHLPAEERLLVLYDSRLVTRSPRSKDPGHGHGNLSQLVVSEQATHRARVLVREARLQLESAFVESQMIIESALPEDSGRYKCMGLNRAGNASHEFRVRVRPERQSPADHDSLPQPAQDQQQPPPPPAKTVASTSQSTGAGPGRASKGSATVQVTMVLVSALMGAVIIAFVLFCVLIYQIKPSSASCSLDGRRLEESLPEAGSRQLSPATHLVAVVPTTVHCDPCTGQSVAVHQASPASSLATLTLGRASVQSSAAQQPLVAPPTEVDYRPFAHQQLAQVHPLSQVRPLDPLNHHLGPPQPALVNPWQPVALL